MQKQSKHLDNSAAHTELSVSRDGFDWDDFVQFTGKYAQYSTTNSEKAL